MNILTPSPSLNLSSLHPRQVMGMSPSQIKNAVIPVVIEQEGRFERSYDIYSRLLKDRIIIIGTEIDPYNQVSTAVVAQLLFLQMSDPAKDINIYINSPGGSVSAGLAIYDTMQLVTCDINTYCMGMAASMGSVLLCAGTKGKRFVLPNADIMIHQVSGGAHGTASDVERSVNHMFQLKQRLNRILARHCGKTPEQIDKDADRDNWMSAQEAVDYGIVDKILENKKDFVPPPSTPAAAATGDTTEPGVSSAS